MSREPQPTTPTTNVPDVLDAGALQFLASLQQRVTEVQAKAAEINARDAALVEAQARLSQQMEAFNAAKGAFEQQQRALQERAAEIERAERDAAARREAILNEALTAAKAESDRLVGAARAEAERLAGEASRQREAVEQQAREAAEKSEAVLARQHEIDEREGRLAREAAGCAARIETVEKSERAVAAREQALHQATREAERAQQELAESAAAFEKKRTSFETRLAELVKNEKAVKSARQQVEAGELKLAARAEDLQKRDLAAQAREQNQRKAQEDLERRRVAVSQSEAQAAQLEATARHLREQAEQIKAAAERQVQQWQDKSAEAQFQADSSLQQVQKLQEQLTAAQSRARALEEEIDQVKVLGMSASPDAQARIDGLSRRAESAEQRASTLQEIIDQHSDEVAKAEARYDAICRQLEAAHASASSGGNEQAARLAEMGRRLEAANAEAAGAVAAREAARAASQEADTLRSTVQRLQQQIAETAEKSVKPEGDFAVDVRRRMEGELAQREEALSVLGQRLLNSEERMVAMQAQLERVTDEVADAEERGFKAGQQSVQSGQRVGGETEGTPVVMDATRRQRLRKVRELLAQEHRKVLLAKEALGRHKAEADSVLQQRARLSQAAQNLQAAEIEVSKSRAKSAAATVVIAAMTTMLAVSGVAWLAGSTLWPSTYAARATLSAESDGRSPTDQQKKAWLAAHERLATDPQVYTLAADQFGQRGMRSLANPAAVQSRFGGAMAMLTDVPGQITFELRGEGREQTARELETFVGAVSAIANSRREARADGLSTSVSKPAEAGREALDDKAQTAVLGSIGAGLLAAAAAGFGVFKLLARVRKGGQAGDPLDAFISQPEGNAGRIGGSERRAA